MSLSPGICCCDSYWLPQWQKLLMCSMEQTAGVRANEHYGALCCKSCGESAHVSCYKDWCEPWWPDKWLILVFSTLPCSQPFPDISVMLISPEILCIQLLCLLFVCLFFLCCVAAGSHFTLELSQDYFHSWLVV